ncbi:conserved hypothetical protein [Streptomyces sp. Mg1]|nr:conserved hypothetical protein [Streptomyces sp. Mg1]
MASAGYRFRETRSGRTMRSAPAPTSLSPLRHRHRPEIGGPVGYSGWTAVGIHLAAIDPRIAAAGFFAGGYVPRAQREEARQVTVPLLFLLQWDDEGNPRQRALDLFDAFGSKEKTLHANLGGHTGTPWFEVEDGSRFYDRHLK